MFAAARLRIVVWMLWAGGVLAYYFAYVPRALFLRDVTLAFDARWAAITVVLVGAAAAAFEAIERPGVVESLRRFGYRVRSGRVSTLLVAAGAAVVPWWLVSDRIGAVLTTISVQPFPFFGEALARLIAGVVGASLICFGAIGAGTLVLRVLGLRAESEGEFVVFAAASGFLVISFGSFLLAGLGMYRPAPVAALIAAACFAGAAAKPEIGDVQPAQLRDRQDRRTTAMWLALTGSALAFGVVAALAPEKEWDALWYHLNLPRLWLEGGRPVDIVEEYVSLYPMTWELVFGAGLVLGGATAAKLLHLVCLPLLAATVWLAARRYISRTSAAAAVALVVTTPTLLWESATAYVDLALAFQVAVACYALARYAEQDELAWGVLAALQFGGAAATKHVGVIVTILALAFYVVMTVRSGRRLAAATQRALLIGVAAAVVPLPWYVRSWVASGNPVFPELFSVFGAAPPERWDALTERGLAGFKARFGYGRSFAHLLWLPWDVTVHGARFGGCLGPLFLVLIPAACFLRPRRGVMLLAAAVIAYAAVWASPLSSYQMRFLMPVVAPMSLLAAAGLEAAADAAGEWHRRGRQLVTAAVFAVAVVNLPPFIRLHERDREGWSGFLTHVLRQPPVGVVSGRESEASYLRRELPAFGAWQAINKDLPSDARVLTFAGGDHFYARRRRVSYDSTVARPAVSATAENAGAAVAALRALGITHVLFDRRELERLHAETLAIGSPAIQRACTVFYEDRRVWVCRLDYSRLTD
jgi:Dolichyl-phosphate-mannose-protein mannosyltransferase